MQILTKMLKQTAVYWPPAGDASGGDDLDAYGQPQHTTPVEIKCRWEQKAVEYMDADGTKQVSNAVVYVDRDLRSKGYIMLGSLTDVTDESDAKANDGAWLINKFDKLPTLKATKFLRTVYL